MRVYVRLTAEYMVEAADQAVLENACDTLVEEAEAAGSGIRLVAPVEVRLVSSDVKELAEAEWLEKEKA